MGLFYGLEELVEELRGGKCQVQLSPQEYENVTPKTGDEIILEKISKTPMSFKEYQKAKEAILRENWVKEKSPFIKRIDRVKDRVSSKTTKLCKGFKKGLRKLRVCALRFGKNMLKEVDLDTNNIKPLKRHDMNSAGQVSSWW